MRTLKRKICDAMPCRPSPFFRPASQRSAADTPFFQGPMVQRQENPQEKEKKDPFTEGLKTTGEQLAEHKPFKDWYEPRLEHLKYTLWDKASPADKAAASATRSTRPSSFTTIHEGSSTPICERRMCIHQ